MQQHFKLEKQKKTQQPANPKPEQQKLFLPHKKQEPSLLSGGGASYEGIRNLAILLLLLANFRLIIENIIQYGVLVDFSHFGHFMDLYRWPALSITLSLNVFVLLAYAIELLAKNRYVDPNVAGILHVANIFSLLFIPSILIIVFQPLFVTGVATSLIVTTLGMKLVSYAHVNHLLRKSYFRTKKSTKSRGTLATLHDPQNYPENISLSNLYLFLLMPTLCYQLSYPRNERIRWSYLALKSIEGLLLCGVIFVMGNQYLLPLVKNSLTPLDRSDYLKILERVLKLSLPNLYVWLIGFYVFFHVWLNILAEITRFGDRNFYKDWWNARDLGQYWRNWNLPVHYWMVRHVFYPSLEYGVPRDIALFLCFFLSAVFHEYCLSVPFGSLKLWAFIGLLAQVPAIKLLKPFRKLVLGNIVFWFSIVIGQPFLILMYYRDYIKLSSANMIQNSEK